METSTAARIEKLEIVLGTRLDPDVHGECDTAMLENEEAVLALAQDIAGQAFVRKPVGLFLSRLRKGHWRSVVPLPPPQARRSYLAPLPTPQEQTRFRSIAHDWTRIQAALQTRRDVDVLWQELKKGCRGYVPEQIIENEHGRSVVASSCDPTDEEAASVRATLIWLIEHPEEAP